jgi:hypothetical protein
MANKYNEVICSTSKTVTPVIYTALRSLTHELVLITFLEHKMGKGRLKWKKKARMFQSTPRRWLYPRKGAGHRNGMGVLNRKIFIENQQI